MEKSNSPQIVYIVSTREADVVSQFHINRLIGIHKGVENDALRIKLKQLAAWINGSVTPIKVFTNKANATRYARKYTKVFRKLKKFALTKKEEIKIYKKITEIPENTLKHLNKYGKCLGFIDCIVTEMYLDE